MALLGFLQHSRWTVRVFTFWAAPEVARMHCAGPAEGAAAALAGRPAAAGRRGGFCGPAIACHTAGAARGRVRLATRRCASYVWRRRRRIWRRRVWRRWHGRVWQQHWCLWQRCGRLWRRQSGGVWRRLCGVWAGRQRVRRCASLQSWDQTCLVSVMWPSGCCSSCAMRPSTLPCTAVTAFIDSRASRSRACMRRRCKQRGALARQPGRGDPRGCLAHGLCAGCAVWAERSLGIPCGCYALRGDAFRPGAGP